VCGANIAVTFWGIEKGELHEIIGDRKWVELYVAIGKSAGCDL